MEPSTKRWLVLLLAVVLAIAIIIAVGAASSTSTAASSTSNISAVVIDAGSTGSRVLGFKFHRDSSGALKLDDELFMRDKPGVSSYANNPRGAAESILKLLDEAKSFIPESAWAQTPLTLKATAGMRLLPEEQADAIIREVEKVLRSSGLRPENPVIEIMDPQEEGLFAWVTVNFLLDQFSKANLTDSYVMLDLGGGSTQIAFVPSKRVEGLEGRSDYMHNISVLKNNVTMYSHSYLGLGLMAARMTMFNISDEVQRVSSPCISSEVPLTFKFSGKEFTIVRDKKAAADKCLGLATAAVEAKGVHSPAELVSSRRSIAAFSYFYDRAAERGMVKDIAGGEVMVGGAVGKGG